MSADESIRGNAVQIDYTSNNDDSVVIPTTAGIAVYWNQNNDLVIRQDGGPNDEDSIIVVSRINAKRLADAILNEVA